MREIIAPLSKETIPTLHAGERVLLSGTIYTARDAAHQKLCALLAAGEAPPFALHGAVIYFVGPTPPPPGHVLGAAGPTSSYRMDGYSEVLLAHGLAGMIGKGRRSPAVIAAMQQHKAVYFAATGGAGALLSRCIVNAEMVAFSALGTEAVRRLTVERMPLTVAIDCAGSDLYTLGRQAYLLGGNE